VDENQMAGDGVPRINALSRDNDSCRTGFYTGAGNKADQPQCEKQDSLRQVSVFAVRMVVLKGGTLTYPAVLFCIYQQAVFKPPSLFSFLIFLLYFPEQINLV